jgi:hypothetical protein
MNSAQNKLQQKTFSLPPPKGKHKVPRPARKPQEGLSAMHSALRQTVWLATAPDIWLRVQELSLFSFWNDVNKIPAAIAIQPAECAELLKDTQQRLVRAASSGNWYHDLHRETITWHKLVCQKFALGMTLLRCEWILRKRRRLL